MSNSSDEVIGLLLASHIILIVIGLPMFIFGIIGNLLNIFSFVYLRQFKKLPSSVFLICSYISSEIILIIGLLPQLIYRISGNDLINNNIIVCKLRWFIGPLSGTVSLHYICFATINQYLILSRIIQYHQLITRRRAIFISIFILLFWIGPLSSSIVFYIQVVNSANMTVCVAINPIFAVYYAYISIIIYSLVPIFVLSIFSLLIWHKFQSNIIQRRSLGQSLTRMLLAQIIIVLLTTIPNVITQIYFFYTRTTLKSSLRLAQESVVSSIFALLGSSTFSFSFYIYILTSKVYRQKIQSLFFQRQHRIQPGILMFNINQQRRNHIN